MFFCGWAWEIWGWVLQGNVECQEWGGNNRHAKNTNTNTHTHTHTHTYIKPHLIPSFHLEKQQQQQQHIFIY